MNTNRFWTGLIFLGLGTSVSAAFDPLGHGAAAKGMAGAYVAVAQDGSAAYWNPAGLSLLDQPQLTASMEDLYGAGLLRYSTLGFSQPKVGGGTLSGQLLHLDTTGEADFFKYSESTYLLAYGRSLCQDCVSVGAGLRYYSATGGGQRGSGLGFDLGLLWRPWDDRLRLAAAWVDANQPRIDWDTGARDTLPYILRLGGLYRLTPKTDLALQWDKRHFFESHWRFGFAQRLVSDRLTLRAGAHRGGDESEWGYALGGGLRFKSFDVDYAWDTVDELGNTQTVSLSMRFGK